MGNYDDKKMSKPEYFDLREKRLKLVYKILYVVVAIWIAILLSISQSPLEKSVIPVYAFLLSASSMIIIQIIKYAIMEFRCMKIIGHLSEDLIRQTEVRYENIWQSFSLILSLCGIAVIPHNFFVERVNAYAFMVIFSVCMGYFIAVSLIKLFKSTYTDKTVKIFDKINIIVGSVAAYSLCAATCLITSNAVAI